MGLEQVEKKESFPLRVVLVESIQDGQSKIKPVIVGETGRGKMSDFILGETKKLKSRVKELEFLKTSRQTSHHREKSLREMRDEKPARNQELAKVWAKLDVLEGRVFLPVKISQQEEEMIAWEPSVFSSPLEKRWWEFVRSKNILLQVAEVSSLHPQALDWLFGAYSARIKISDALYPEDKDAAKVELRGFQKKYSEVPSGDMTTALTPLMRLISESIPY
jgi:hypothetical protein